MSFSFHYRRSTVHYLSTSHPDPLTNDAKSRGRRVLQSIFSPHPSFHELEKDVQDAAHNGTCDTETAVNLQNMLAPFFLVKRPLIYIPEETADVFIPIDWAILITPTGKHFVTKLHWMAEIMRLQTESLGYVIYLKDNSNKYIFICPKDEKFFYNGRYSWNLSTAKTIAAYAIRNQECLIVNTGICDLRFPEFQGIPPLYVTNVLTVPIIDQSGHCYGALEFYRDSGIHYEMSHLKRVNFLLMWVGDAMKFNEQAVIYKRYTDINDYLLKNISESFAMDYDNECDPILFNILTLSRQTLDAESTTIFLYKNNQLCKSMTTDNDLNDKPKLEKLRLQKELQLANITFTSNHLINHPDVYKDPRFDKEIDIKTGKIIRSVLATPLGGSENTPFGVLQAFNKISGDTFSDIDEQFIQDIQQYCTLWLHYQKECESLYQQGLTNQVMSNLIFHQISKPMKLSDNFSMSETIIVPPDFQNFDFNPYPQYLDDITKLIFYMFTQKCTSLVTNNRRYLYNFIYMVKKSYRKRKYFNFTLGFNAMHSVYCLLQYNSGVFNTYEKFALLVTALCFHIDSIGQTINFLHLSNSPIIGQYPSYDLENHKYWLITYLLDCSRLLEKCDANVKHQIFDQIKENIFSRNMRKNLHNRVALKSIFDSGEFTVKITEHRYLLRSLIIGVANNIYLTKNLTSANYLIDRCIEECSEEYEKITIGDNGSAVSLDLIEYRKVHLEFMRLLPLPSFDLMRNIIVQAEHLYKRSLETWKAQLNIIAKGQ